MLNTYIHTLVYCRYYLDSLVKARHAVTDFIECEVDMAIHLGDIVDYHAKKHGESEAALDAILECFDGLDGRPVLHCIGNHCLYNAPRHVLNEKLGIREKVQSSGNGVVGKHSYFSFKPKMRAQESVQYNFIVLDGYDVSLLGWEPGHPHHEKAREILDSMNPNCDQNSNFGLEGLDKRFVKFGGGVSEEQLEWLEKELEGSRLAGEKCIVCCHLCMHPMTCPETCLLYNYDKVLSKLDKYKGTVVATLAGHAHRGGYFFDQDTGIHHRVCEAVLETPPGDQCHAVVSIFDDRIEIQGRGAFDTDTWMLGDGN